MLHDLATTDGPGSLAMEGGRVRLSADVGIVGAGIAGLILAERLVRHGLSVVVLESGGYHQEGDTHPLNAVTLTGAPYRGATLGRARCLGGTSTRWGGALLPFLPEDIEPRPELDLPGWPVRQSDLAPYVAELEALFGLAPGPYEATASSLREIIAAGDAAFLPREAKWPAFRCRNVATLLRAPIETSRDLIVVLNATVCGFEADGAPVRVTGLIARADGGRKLYLAARHVVLCAGAIEATRLLLILDRSTDGALTRNGNVLGRTFSDHLSVPLATVDTTAPNWLNHLAGFRFQKGTMRSLRFDLAAGTRRAAGCAAGFVHIAPRPLATTGFDHVRDFFRSVQRRRPDPFALLRVLSDAPYLARLVQWRLLHGQLYWPRPAAYDVHVVVEQVPDPANRITLSAETDRFGCPLAEIHWRMTDRDVATFRAVACAFDAFWQVGPLGKVGRLVWTSPPADLGAADLSEVDNIYHPVGSTRMGGSAESAVVDGDLAVHGAVNLSVAATSVFPAGGTSNPTMMLILFAMRLGDHLGVRLSAPAATGGVSAGPHSALTA